MFCPNCGIKVDDHHSPLNFYASDSATFAFGDTEASCAGCHSHLIVKACGEKGRKMLTIAAFLPINKPVVHQAYSTADTVQSGGTITFESFASNFSGPCKVLSEAVDEPVIR